MSMTEKEFIALPDDKFNQMIAGWAGLCWHTSKKKVVLSCDDDRMPDREGYYCEKCGQWFQENPDFRHSPEGLKIMLEWLKKNYPIELKSAIAQWIANFYEHRDINSYLAIAIGKNKRGD